MLLSEVKLPELSSLVLGLSLSRGGRGGRRKGVRSRRWEYDHDDADQDADVDDDTTWKWGRR